jgi:Putative metallopeptidase
MRKSNVSYTLQIAPLKRQFGFVLLLCISCVLSTPNSALARKAISLKSNQIEISYVPPKNAAHEETYRYIKERQVLEKFQAFLSPLRLPRKLLLKTEGCDGEVNAWYEDDAITVCYEYLYDIIQNAPQKTTPAGVTRLDAIIGPMVEVFFHELAHALFDYYHTPILGREEDAADEFAAYYLLQFGGDDARRLIAGAAYAYNREASLPSLKKNPFADEHGLPAQRFYNILCTAYGKDSRLFTDVVEKSYLPKERAENCKDEYAKVVHAMKILIDPDINETVARQVKAKRWLRF